MALNNLHITVIIFMTTITVSLVLAQPEEIIINNTNVFEQKQRAPVPFPHGLHMTGNLSCKDCHHVYQNGKNVLDESELTDGNQNIRCSHCHALKSAGGRYGLMDAFHLQCMGCHGRIARKGQKSGPRLCGQCHPRK